MEYNWSQQLSLFDIAFLVDGNVPEMEGFSFSNDSLLASLALFGAISKTSLG